MPKQPDPNAPFSAQPPMVQAGIVLGRVILALATSIVVGLLVRAVVWVWT